MRSDRVERGILRLRLTSILLVALVVLVAGCGGSSKKSASTNTESTATQTTSAETTATETTAGTSNSGSAVDCTQLANLSKKYTAAFSSMGANADMGQVAQSLDDFAAQVPAEIRPDMQVIADVFKEYAKAMEGVSAGTATTPEQVAKLQKLSTLLSQKKVTQATQHLQAWMQATCPQLANP
jgi:predicted RND superfamily exporter protein